VAQAAIFVYGALLCCTERRQNESAKNNTWKQWPLFFSFFTKKDLTEPAQQLSTDEQGQLTDQSRSRRKSSRADPVEADSNRNRADA
jgi:hypothetical protein